ncbi:macro domain-containing protein [Phycisphaeraceae bacterium D3-23]
MPTTITAYHGDIFDVKADCLVCSANVFLTLSGGVGGELLRRYGTETQAPLQHYLSTRAIRYTTRGDVVVTSPANTPYRRVLHAVAVDGMYDSTVDVVTQVVRRSLDAAAAAGCRSIVFPALATGYGHLTFADFLAGWSAGLADCPRSFDAITLAVRDADEARLAQTQLAASRPAPGLAPREGDTR